MSNWYQEEVAGDRYIYDSDKNPVILGCPQGAPVFVIPGEHEKEAERACAAHNADLAALDEDNDIYRELHERLAADNVQLRQRVAELDAICVNLQAQAALHYQARIADGHAMTAAGPWRTDIENAPRDRDVLMCFESRLGKLFYVTAHADLGYRKACIAWANINQPPETIP